MSNNQELLDKLYEAIMNYDTKGAVQLAQEIVDSGLDVMEAIGVASQAINKIGDQFECGDIFLPGLMRAGETMKQCMNVLAGHISAQGKVKKKGKVVIGAVAGDIHDIGKNLVATMLTVHGFEVIDLGVDVAPMKFAETAEMENAQFIALSSLMTTSMPYQRDVVNLLQEMGVRDKYFIVVGGGPVTSDFARDIGADGWGVSAVSAVRVCEQLLEAGQQPPVSQILIVE